jgi:hypothetical protein
MISEQTAIHTPTSALQFRPFTGTAVAVDDTDIPPTGSRGQPQVVAQQAPTLTIRVLGALASWANPCVAIGNGSIRACQRALVSAWNAYVSAHTFTLDNGTTVWIDESQTFFLDGAPCDRTSTSGQGSINDYDQWLQAQVWGW